MYLKYSFVFFVAVYLPPQTNAGTKTALYTAISKQESTHPEEKLKSVLPHFYQHVKCANRGENSRPPLLYTQRRVQSSRSPSIWQIWP